MKMCKTLQCALTFAIDDTNSDVIADDRTSGLACLKSGDEVAIVATDDNYG